MKNLFDFECNQTKSAKSIFEQTGWHRPSPLAICQDTSVLQAVKDFDYDLDCPGFENYFIARTGYRLDMIEIVKNGNREYLTKFLANPKIPCVDKSWQITRAKIQDCWEIWRNHNESHC